MNINDFLTSLRDELELENELSHESKIKELAEWDSLTAMVLIGYISKEFDVNLNASDLDEIETVKDLIVKIGVEKIED